MKTLKTGRVALATLAMIASTAMAAGTLGVGPAAAASSADIASRPSAAKPTIVLVHGAFADSSSWSAEITTLQGKGYRVVAVANPLRGVGSDSAYLKSVLSTIDGPVVLVGHSYAGFLITAAAADPDVKALVYVAAYIPQAGESPADLTYKDPGSLLSGDNLVTRATPDGGTDIYVNPKTFRHVYAGGLSRAKSANAAVVQRPIAAAALGEKATVSAPRSTTTWEIVALDDNAIPTKTQFFMAHRANAHVVTTHSGHDVPAARPKVVVKTILAAARSV